MADYDPMNPVHAGYKTGGISRKKIKTTIRGGAGGYPPIPGIKTYDEYIKEKDFTQSPSDFRSPLDTKRPPLNDTVLPKKKFPKSQGY